MDKIGEAIKHSETLQSLFVACVMFGFVGIVNFIRFMSSFIYDKFFKNGK